MALAARHRRQQARPPAARALQAALAARWERRPALGEGLSLWRYLGGPWEPAGSWPFTGPSAAGAGVAG
ncbi:MAG TPA: hypothetical protein VFP61_10125 [Acidimicrobiales bacterium]|nr:hypothetical protein [Acidimicrobiales bacterium]